jgi:hypothetical protein
LFFDSSMRAAVADALRTSSSRISAAGSTLPVL